MYSYVNVFYKYYINAEDHFENCIHIIILIYILIKFYVYIIVIIIKIYRFNIIPQFIILWYTESFLFPIVLKFFTHKFKVF